MQQARSRLRAAGALGLCGALGGCALIGDYDFSGYHTSPDGGPDTDGMVLIGTFIGGGVHAEASGIALTGQILWHGKAQSGQTADGIELTGGLR